MGRKPLARGIHRLTDRAIRAAKAPAMMHDGGGLYLQITKGAPLASGEPGPDRHSWLLRYTAPNGKKRDMGLGTLDALSLADARKEADRWRALARAGGDPIEQRRLERLAKAAEADKGVSFKQAAERYVTAQASGWRSEKHRKLWEASLELHAHPKIGKLPVALVNVDAVLSVLEPIWSTKPETAARVRQRMEAVLDWADARGLREGENPARWARLQHTLPKRVDVKPVQHRPALPYADLPGFMTQLRQADGVSALALRFTILTAARTTEALAAPWDEFDLGEALWTIPAERMKMKRDHRVPLSRQTVELLRDLRNAHPRSKVVFPGLGTGRSLSTNAMLAALDRLKKPDGKPWGDVITVHGFRSTFKDWAADCTAFPREVAEAALAHVVADKTEAAYRRGDALEKRRRLMQAWADYADKEAGGQVVQLRLGERK